MYFDIQDESKIGVQFKLLNIFGKHSVVCQNLKLKPQVVNKSDMIIHVHECKITRLQIAIDSSKQQLLSARVTGVRLMLKFNKNVQIASTAKTLQKPEIQQFKKVISSEETYDKIKYFESSPFKKMVMEQVLRKTNLLIENVAYFHNFQIDISLLYSQAPIQKCVGLKVSELNICQRFIINRTKNGQSQKDEEIECKLNGIGLYLGITEHETMIKPSFHKEVIKPSDNGFKKRFILQKNQLVVYFNEGNNTLSVISQLLEFNLSSFYIRELISIIAQVKPLLSKAPKIRPGQGKPIISGKYKFSQGTAEWWKFIGMRLVEKIKEKEQYNIIQNRQYRLYLYCLLYCYTYGAEPIYLNYIQNSERYKKTKHVMNSHKFIIEKVYKIQHKQLDPLEEMQLRGFVSFLSMKPKKKEQRNGFFEIRNTLWQEISKMSSERQLDYNNVKKIKYQDIKKSKVFINFSNCLRFMTEYERQSKNTLSIFLRIKSLRLNLVETREEIKMLKQIYQEHPQRFHLVKSHMMNSYFYEHLKNATKEGENTNIGVQKVTQTNEKAFKKKETAKQHQVKKQVQQQLAPFLSLNAQQINMQMIENRFSLTIGKFQGKQPSQKQKIIDLKSLSVVNSALEKYSERQGRIVNVGSELQFCIISIFINLTVKIAEKILMIKTLVENSQTKVSSDDESNDPFLKKFMNKKIISDVLFNNPQKQSIHFLIKSVTIVTPAFDKDKIFQINLSKFECDYPSFGTKTVSLEKIELKRTTLQNLKNHSWRRLGENESIILQNDRSFTILISESYQEKIDPKYFGFVKSFTTTALNEEKSKSKQSSPMIQHDARSCFNLIIPFLFVQLACEDIYYLMIMKKFWFELLKNPYIFRPKLKMMQGLEEANKPQNKSTTFKFIKQIQKNTKLLFQTHITLNGFEFIFNGDNSLTDEDDYSGVNRICTLMIDSINYDAFSGLKEDHTKIKIKNMYIRNMLGDDTLNIQALEDVFKDYMEKKEPLIQRKNNQFCENSYLMLYNHYIEDFQTQDKIPFLDIDIFKSMNIEKLKGNNDINIQVKQFEVFHEPKFFKCLMEIFTKLDLISGKHYEQNRAKFFEKSFIKESNEQRDFQMEEKFLNQNKEILYSKDFSVVNSMRINIKKVNLIVLLESEPVYCIALDSISVNHKTESYITVYNINISEAYIIDVSVTNGPHSMIIESTTPIQINFTQYNCQLLKERYKRSALMRIEVNQAVIHFLNKKVMEFVNFINQLKEDVLGKPQKSPKQSKGTDSDDYPFCYEIILIDSKAILYRNSLSKQRFHSRIGTISVANFRSKSTEETIKRRTMTNFNRRKSQLHSGHSIPSKKNVTKNPNSDELLESIDDIANETYYEEMEEISENHFKSFLDQSIEENQKNDFIYIDIFNFSIDGRHRKKDILFADKMHMSFQDIELKIFIPQLDLCIDNDDFRLLIRLTEQNFCQQDRYFRVNPVYRPQRIEKFITIFHLIMIKIQCIKGDYGIYEGKDIQQAQKVRFKNSSEEQKAEKMNILNLRDLRGKDVSFINGQKLDEIQIQKIYAQEENMNPFIEKYVRQKNDPIIQVKPQTISHSQQYFTKLSKIFEIFSKLGQQYDEPSSDFDYKEQEILAHPKKGKIINMKDEQQQSSNCEKLMRWLSGMCDKCFWWTKSDINEVQPYNIAKAILDREIQRRKKLKSNMIQEHTIFCNGDYNISHIFNDKQMIRLENKVSPQTFFPLYDPKYPNRLYFRMDMETTKEKKMYILAKQLDMTYEPNKGLLQLSSFFAKPYGPYQDYDPPFIASNFNNFRPVQMYMELKDSCLDIKKDFIKLDSKKFERIQSTQRIILFLDLIYNMQTMGDMVKGPGRSVKEADIILQAFHSIYKEGETQFIELSNLMEMIYRNEANVSYKKTERTKFDEKIIVKPYFDKEKSVNFFIPAFSIKSLMQIYKANFQPQKVSPKLEESKQDLDEMKMKKLNSVKSTRYLEDNQKQPKAEKLVSKIDEKKQQIKQKDVESSITNRKIYMQSMCINLESKLHTSFVKIYTKNFMFLNLYSNMVKTEKSKMELNSELSIDYWNLHLLEFEPFLQPWNSKLIMKHIKRENTLSKKIKLESFNKALQVDDYKNHSNWLNLNLSLAFFHTYKQLQLKYFQGKDQKEEECFDVTFKELPDLLKLDFKESQAEISKSYNKFPKKSNFPEAMKNFFGRRFIVENQAIRKKGSDMREKYFHEYGTIYNLYHSYFDHEKRKKTICYRTPFRILNCYSEKMTIRIKVKHRSSTIQSPKYVEWSYRLGKGEYFALPSLIYKQDFLISFEHSHKHINSALTLVNAAFDSNSNTGQNLMLLEQQEQDNFMSAQYLMQLHSEKLDFRRDKNSRILKKLFSEDSKKDRYLDSRDILIKTGKRIFALICTKSEYDNDKEKSKMQFYDTLLAIVTPIEIYNNCPIPLTVILNGKKEYKLPSNKSTYINQDLNFKNIHETVIEFREHILHRQFTFLKKENQNHTYFMEIDRMQSVNVRVIKETTSTFSIEIFADWIIENHTDEEFQLDYGTKLFPIDRHSSSSLSIENYQHGKKIEIQLSIYSIDDTHHYPYNVITNGTQATEILTLYKILPGSQQKRKLLEKKNNLKITRYCCLKGYPFKENTKEKKSDQIFKVYEFVLKIAPYEQCKLTKTLSLRYKTKMKNKTNKILLLYQFSFQFLIEKLYPDNEVCVWSYDFLPEHYLIEKRHMDTETNNNFEELGEERQNRQNEQITLSDPFKFDQSMGKMVTIKFKQNPRGSSNDGEFFRNFSYLKMEINQYDHSSLYEFTQVNVNSNDQFPIYIHNTTQETIKIYENGQNFLVKPKSKVPFSWSNLVHNTHEIDVEIGDVKKTYSFKQNQEFEPIIIKDENVAKPTLQEPKTNFHKEMCRVKYGLIEGKFETIIDIKQNSLIILPGIEGIEYKFDMKNAVKMTISAQSIELNMGPKQQPLIIYPSNETFQTWLSYLNYTINQDIVTKVSFTIQTYKNSRLFFFHNVQLGRQNDYLTSSENYFVENVFVSVINEKPEEVILIHLGDIRLTKQDRVCRLGYEDYQIQKCDRKLQVKEVKANNQLLNAVNPVILTQIKKSKTPFISIITKKRNLVKSKDDLEAFEFKDELITHFESFRFFLDQAQAMVQASLIPKLLSLKNQMQKVQTQYKIVQSQQEDKNQSEKKIKDEKKDNNQLMVRKQSSPSSNQQETAPSSEQQSYQLYLSFLQIRPIKMTVSVSFDKLSKDEQQERMNMQILNMLPVGIENAIITIDSYMFHHIYEDKEQVMKQIQQFYKTQLTKQVLINAGNLQFLVAIDLIKNLGIGVKNIFYDPIYEFASNKDIKGTTSTLLEGLFSLVLLIISFFVKICNLVFKILAICTFDTDYKAKRQIFRKQIFKSPLDGAVFGGKYFWKIFKSVKDDFIRLPKQYYEDYSVLGCFWGFILAILNIFPWFLKVFITFYDMIYVIGIGVLSWGHYEQNAMKNRSRPIRVFHKKKLVEYNLLEAKAYQIMRQHNINLTEKQSILYVRDVDNVQKTTSYLILSDYSLLYCNNRLSIFDEIVLYKVLQFKVVYPQQKKKGKNSVYLQISLKSPNIRKFLFIQFTKYTYSIKFKCYEELLQLLQKLEQLKERSELSNRITQKYDYAFVDDKRAFNKEEIIKRRKRTQPLEYKEMNYLQEEPDYTENAILDNKQLNLNEKHENVV